MDMYVPPAVTLALRLRLIDALTAQQDGSPVLEDAALLCRPPNIERILKNSTTIGRLFAELELPANAMLSEDGHFPLD